DLLDLFLARLAARRHAVHARPVGRRGRLLLRVRAGCCKEKKRNGSSKIPLLTVSNSAHSSPRTVLYFSRDGLQIDLPYRFNKSARVCKLAGNDLFPRPARSLWPERVRIGIVGGEGLAVPARCGAGRTLCATIGPRHQLWLARSRAT